VCREHRTRRNKGTCVPYKKNQPSPPQARIELALDHKRRKWPICRNTLILGLVNGKTEDENRIYEGYSNHLFLAAVPGSSSPMGKGAYIHMKIGKSNCMLSAPSFKMGPDNNMQSTIEYTPPSKNVSIGDWITIYSVKIVQLDKVARTVEVQIKGAQQKTERDSQ